MYILPINLKVFVFVDSEIIKIFEIFKFFKFFKKIV